jgi:uncharacterized protein (TIGR03790 family)
VPPQNVLKTSWAGSNLTWDKTNFDSVILNPLLAMLSVRALTNQIDYVLLSMDIPYQITDESGLNSTTAALFYGFKPDLPASPMYNPASCNLPAGSSNSYAGSEGIFRSTPPISATSNSFLVTMVTSSNLALAKLIIDQGTASDGTFPTQTVYLAKSTDVDRNVRYQTFDNAVFDTRLRGNYSVQRIDTYTISDLGNILGGQTGSYNYGVSGVWFIPGGLADNLTSYGGLILQDNSGQLSILSFLAAGASGSYGTVVEPCNYLEKFPSPEDYFFQARGFNLAESYYQSVTNPYQGLLIGEPLAAPFARSASGSWSNLPPYSLLGGTTNLTLGFAASDSNHPVQQVDLFLDGTWLQTLTNLPPARSNLLNVTINGQAMSYLVPLNTTIKSVTSNLTSVLNLTSNTTKVFAAAHGDRIELRSVDSTKTGSQVSISVSNSIGTGASFTTRIRASRTNFLDTLAFGVHNLVVNSGASPPPGGSWLHLTITRTNGLPITLGSTNNSTTITNIALLVSDLIDQVNANAQLMAADGCIAEDFIDYSLHVSPNNHGAEFNLRARTTGWNAAQIQASLTGSSGLYFSISPTGTNPLQDNLPDLEPRNHLYVIAGLTNLPLTFPFNSATQANGFHTLTAVAYEGSHVRTQARAQQTIQIQNGALSATFTTLVGGTNTALEATLQFAVIATTNNISKIELFSTGGLQGTVSGLSNATFSVFGTKLGLGLHPFYAIVTASNGKQYRTDTKWIRLVSAEPLFGVSITTPPPHLSWPATAGRSYDILSATNIATNFQVRASITTSNNSGQWTETNPASAVQRFYRVRSSN